MYPNFLQILEKSYFRKKKAKNYEIRNKNVIKT